LLKQLLDGYFEDKRFFKKWIFGQNLELFFQAQVLQALEKNIFSNFLKI